MRQIVTDFQPFENHKKLLKNMADRHLESRFLPTKIREEPEIDALLAPVRDDEGAKLFFTTAFIVCTLGLNFWINDWQSFYKLKNIRSIINKYSEQIGHFVVAETSIIRSRPGVVSLYMLQNHIDDETISRALSDIYEVSVKNMHGDSEFERAQFDLMRYSTVEPLFSDRNKLAMLVDYYEKIRSVGDTRNKSDYWLQFGIACNIHNDFERAQMAFDNAYARERAKARPNTTRIDNYYSRFLIEKAVHVNDAIEAFSLFKKGYQGLLRQIFHEDNRHYPFKAGRAIASVAIKHYESWTEAQKKQFLRDCEDLRDKALAWKSKNRGSYLDVDLLIREVGKILDQCSAR